MKFKTAFTAAAALTLATAAYAQVGPEVGATIYTAEGDEVATIESMADGIAVIDTGTYTGSIPANVLAEGPNGHAFSDRSGPLLRVLTEQDSLAGGQAVGFHNHRALVGFQVIEGAGLVGEDMEFRTRDAGLFHQVQGEAFASFDLSGGSRWAEDRYS